MEPTTNQKSIELSTSLEDGHEYGQMPPVVDGAPVLTAASAPKVLPDQDWLCLQGPCRHYHRFAHYIDHEEALADEPTGETEEYLDPGSNTIKTRPAMRITGGKATHWGDGTPIVRHRVIHHHCYPSPGIEMPMQDEVVLECNRWDPLVDEDSDPEAIRLELHRAKYRLRVLQAGGTLPSGCLPRDPRNPVL